MALIKLTNGHYVETEMVADAYLHQRYGGPCLEIFFKSDHLEHILICGEEAVEGWASWRHHVDSKPEEEHRTFVFGDRGRQSALRADCTLDVERGCSTGGEGDRSK